MTAFVIPNAIQLSTRQAKYNFASLLSRDTTFDVIYNIWRSARPEDAIGIGSRSQSSMDSPGAVETGAAVEIVAGVDGIVVVPLKKADVVCLWQG